MSYTTDRYVIEDSHLDGITLTSCGITENHPSHTAGIRIYHEYSLSFIVKGKGKLIYGNKTYNLSAGEGFLIVPNIPIEYIGDKLEPWTYYYVCFHGTGAEKLLWDACLNQDSPTFTFNLTPDTFNELTLMHASGKTRASKGYGVLGHLLVLMSRIVARSTPASTSWSPEGHVKKAIRYIRDNYPYGITVEDVAYQLGLDRTYLYRLFLKYVSVTPSEFILATRLESAVAKLKDTDLSISEIAAVSGFSDVSHFYKAFTKKYGTSPKKYRESLKE